MDDAAKLPSDSDATLSHSADKADVTNIGPYRLIRKLS
jgi:hypothetical protein